MSSNIKKNILDIYNRMSSNKIFKIVESLGLFSIITSASVILTRTNISTTGASFAIPVTLVGLFVFIRSFAHNRAPLKIFDVFFATVNLCAYFFLRTVIGYDSVKNYLYTFFSFDASQFNTFNTFFAVSYGCAQLCIGYFLSKYSGKLLSVFGLIISALLLSLTRIDGFANYMIPFIVHGIIGVLCSAYAVSLGTFIRNIKPTISGFGVLYSSLIIFSSIVVNILSNYFSSIPIGAAEFNYMMYIVGGSLGISAVYLAIHHFFLNEQEVVITSDADKAQESVSYTDVLTIIFTNKVYTSLAFQAIAFVLAGALFRFAFLDEICGRCTEVGLVGLMELKKQAKQFLELGFITGTVGIISFSGILKEKNLMSFYSLLNLSSILVIAFHYFIAPLSFTVIKIALCTSFSANIGHNIPQIIAGSTEKNASVANTMVGMFNSFSMLIGTALIAGKIMPDLLSASTAILVLVVVNFISLMVSFMMPNKNELNK